MKQDINTIYECPVCKEQVIDEFAHQCSKCCCFRKKILSRPEYRNLNTIDRYHEELTGEKW